MKPHKSNSDRFISFLVYAYFLVSPFVIVGMGWVIHTQRATIADLRDDLRWERLDRFVDEALANKSGK